VAGEERRRAERLEKSFRVEVREFRFPLAGRQGHAVSCVDLSEGGLRIESPRPYKAGDKLQVKIFIPSLNKYHPGFFKVFESDAGQHLQAIAEVAHVETLPGGSCRLGIRFLDVDEDDWKALRNFIAKAIAAAES